MTGVSETIRGRGYKWLLARWYIPILAPVAVAGWLVRWLDDRPQRSPAEVMADELDAISEAERINGYAAARGPKLANSIVDTRYRDTLRNLDQGQRKKADGLRSNPGRRARFLRRMSRQLRRKQAP